MSVLFLLASTLLGNPQLNASLDRFPSRKHEWMTLVKQTPESERPAVVYVLENMPLKDLKELPTSKVIQAVDLAYKARTSLSWGKKIPSEVFFDSVAPYACLTEPRESLRAIFQSRYMLLVQGTKTPGEAAMLINQHLFKDYHVSYNVKRRATDQSTPDTIKQGMATCTGLSIMLVDALRAVGVPSRVAGIRSWPGRGGNHTWVEVWSEGSWHFIGAAEPDPAGLDHGWFADEAGGAHANIPSEAIYAVTFNDPGGRFPLEWEPGVSIPAVNVTARYKRKPVADVTRLLVDVTEKGQRVKANVTAVSAITGNQCVVGRSLGANADVNNFVSAFATKGETYLVKATLEGRTTTAIVTASGDTVVHLNFDKSDATGLGPIFQDRFGADAQKAKIASKVLGVTPFDSKAAEIAWTNFKSLPDPAMQADFDAKTVRTSDRVSPYLWRTVGEKPKNGWGLVIAMHGGGNVAKEENDQEWQYMFKSYYHDHPESGGYVYLALRAPNDTWNGFYDDSISPLIERLILQFVKFGDVDPSRVYACGASHGGYGTFVIGPKIPYRFAALHPAAGAATDGETQGENLRNVHFTFAVGENDKDYGRVDRDRAFELKREEWKAKYGGFEGGLEVVPGVGHLINKHEANETSELLKNTRNSYPKRVIWVQSDRVLNRFYWLEAETPTAKGRIDAKIDGATITLTTENQGAISLWLSPELVDLTKPITVVRDGRSSTYNVTPSLETYCEGLLATGDPQLAAPVKIVVPAPEK